MVTDILYTGKENARPSKELCSILGLSKRELQKAIEKERRAGEPICASTDKDTPGYYLAADEYELAEYCGILGHRAKEIYITRQSLVKVLKGIEQQKSGQVFLPHSEPEQVSLGCTKK